jgi:hypothetical protein
MENSRDDRCYLMVKDACEYSGLSRTRLYQIMWQLKARKAGRTTLVLRAALDAYLQSLPSAETRRPGDKPGKRGFVPRRPR